MLAICPLFQKRETKSKSALTCNNILLARFLGDLFAFGLLSHQSNPKIIAGFIPEANKTRLFVRNKYPLVSLLLKPITDNRNIGANKLFYCAVIRLLECFLLELYQKLVFFLFKKNNK